MKRIIILLYGLLFVSSYIFAEGQQREIKKDSSYLAWTLNAFTMYTTDGSSCTYKVGTSSIPIRGLTGGTTNVNLLSAEQDTLDELISAINGISNITCVRTQGCYGDGLSSNLATVTTWADASVSTNTLLLSQTLGQSYILTAGADKWQNVVNDYLVKATFATGTTAINIYDGTASTTLLYSQDVATTNTDEPCDLDSGYIVGTEETATRFDVVSSTWITAGRVFISHLQRRE